MSIYINGLKMPEKDEVLTLRIWGNGCVETLESYHSEILSGVKAISGIDVKPVVRGKWKLSPNHSEGICSVCQYKIFGRPYQNSYLIVPYNFCPSCGADMSGTNNE